MNRPNALPTLERITGCALDRHDMHDQWLSFVARHIYGYHLCSCKEPTFQIDAASRTCEEWSVGRIRTVAGKARLTRAATEISGDGRPRYVAFMSMRGRLEFEQLRRTQSFGPQSLTLISGADPVVHTKLGDNDTITLAMPRDFVDQRLAGAENLCARTLDVQRGLGQLVQQSAIALQQNAALMTEGEFVGAARTVAELVLLSIGSRAGLQSTDRSIRASNLARIKRAIRNELSNPDFELSKVARVCGISLGYLHKLFRDDGCTAWEYLKSERLRRARQMLETLGSGPNRVTDVAIACGFSNMSQFSTAFRMAFSVRPSEVANRRR